MTHVQQEQILFKKLYEELCNGNDLPFIGRFLQRTARTMPHNTAIIYEDKNITYLQLYYYATQLSKKLRECGINPRDRIILLYENMPEFYISYFGILQIGAVVVPLNTFLQEQEIIHILDDATPALIIVSASLLSVLQSAALLRSIPILTDQDLAYGKTIPTVLTHFEVTDLGIDEMAALLYTSGTTGAPKGVMLSSRNIGTNVLQGVVRFKPLQTDKVLAILPLFHSFAQNTCIWAAILMGCAVILVPKIDRRSLVQGLKKAPTILVGVPALFGLLCLMKTAPIEQVRICISGGDALPDRIRAAFALIYRRKICNGYGLTEASPFVSGDMYDELTATANVGSLVVGMTCNIKDDQGIPVPRGQVGQLWVKGDNIMLGYYKSPEMTASVLQDGWLSTGDLVFLDYKNRIIITGRYKDLIIHKGFNIYPQEIENIILMHPDVIRVAVLGKPDADSGEIPIAYVQLKQENKRIVNQLEALCTKNIAAYKIPRQFICNTESLPITATGKVDKKLLKKQL